jgi:uncharacterized protein YbaR (Trm112 family)
VDIAVVQGMRYFYLGAKESEYFFTSSVLLPSQDINMIPVLLPSQGRNMIPVLLPSQDRNMIPVLLPSQDRNMIHS